ncbi:MAG: DMT family transporter [Candidatus Pacebacteria bacterium]|nr:DMT family transporter [Candidatus Paceibacterota bacterium]
MKNKGIYFAYAAALISGVSVFLNKFAVGIWDNSSVFTTAKNLVVVFLLTSLLLSLKKIGELKKLSKKQWLQMVLIGFIGGSIPFLLFFKGLSSASATNAAFIHKTLFVWVAVLALPFLKEKISFLQLIALGALFGGVYLFSSPSDFKIGHGEFLIFAATLMWAVENIIAKKVLKNISSLAVGWGRMFFGSAFLLMFLMFTGNISGLFYGVSGKGFGWLIFCCFLLFAYVITWYSALKRLPAMVVSSILVLAAPITSLLNSVFVAHQIKTDLIFPIFLILFGVLLIGNLHERFAAFHQVRSSS